jgi:catechol 2,3-dioxygenase-like lactoylglutathione lyase family enzyme
MKNPADASEALNGLLERGEISAEAYAEYSATAEAAFSSGAGVSPHTRQAAMFDHITLRVADLPMASSAFATVLGQLEIEQTTSTPSLSVWGNFALTPTDEQHPIARRVHIAFVAPTRAHVDRFWRAGVDAGFADDGPAGPRPQYADDYYAAFLKDAAGNGFDAVHRNGQRPGEPAQNIHIAFSRDDDDVRRFHADATAAGYRSNGEPGERARYHDGYYAAYVLDPDGNNIEVVNHHR